MSPALATVVVGAAQLLLSQMRDLQTARWTSGVGSLASLGYAVIVFGLAASQVRRCHARVCAFSCHACMAAAHASLWWALSALGLAASQERAQTLCAYPCGTSCNVTRAPAAMSPPPVVTAVASQVGNRLGSVTPGYTDVLSVKVFSAFNALGAVAFGLKCG